MKNIRKGIDFLKTRGLRVFIRAVFNKLRGRPASYGLTNIIPIERVGNMIFKRQQEESAGLDMPALIEKLEHKPLISVIMPLYNSPLKWLETAISSLATQSYEYWELCAVDDGSTNSKASDLMLRMSQEDKRIRLFIMDKNSGISAASNKALEMAQGEYVALMDHDDELTSDALFWMVCEINDHPDTDFVYSDECRIDSTKRNEKYNFFCKPDWSPSLLINYMYTGHLTVYRTSLVRELGGFRSEFDFSQDYDLALRMGNAARNIRHVERILYLWRAVRGSAAIGGKDYARESNIAAVKDWYKAGGMEASVADIDHINDVRPVLPKDLKVSIIIPSDNIDNMMQCIKDVQSKTDYQNCEIVVVTNKKASEELLREYSGLSNLRVCLYDNSRPFNFSDKCNKGAQAATGSAFLFYNDDAVPKTEQWLERLLEVSILPGVGAVGPVMLWGNDLIQSAGLITGTQSMCDNAFANGYDFFSKPSAIYGFHLLRDVSLLSGACILINKEAFEKVGGFDADNFSNAFSDMDICFRLGEAGFRCVCTPYAAVVHDTQNTWRESSKPDMLFPGFLHRWGRKFERDPYFTDSMKDLYYQPYPFPFAKFYVPEHPAPKKEGGRDILFVAHNIHLVGAPVVMMYMIQILLENGDRPVLLCSGDGALRQDFVDMGVIVIIDAAFQYEYPVFEYFARNFDIVVVNTLGCGKAVSCLSGSLPPVLWWIHECPMTLKDYKDQIPKTIGSNIKPYAGSAYSARTLYDAGLQYDYGVLVYGIPDAVQEAAAIDCPAPAQRGKAVFLIVGTIYHRKGQDVLLKAIEFLDEKTVRQSQFVFIGAAPEDDLLLDRLLAMKEKNSSIVYFETMPNDELLTWYQKSDCLIVPSREDPLPVVAIDSMMFSKPVICSDGAGTADYITSFENGIVFPSEDAKALARHIEFAVDNRDKIAQMGQKARKDIYEKHFTMEVFRKNVLKIIDIL